MIHISKTAAALSVLVWGALTMSVRAQDSDEPQPQPRTAARQERSTQSAPRSARDETVIEAPAPPPPPGSAQGPPIRFVAPPGLSEEAIRSFNEIPPGIQEDEEPEPEAPMNPFDQEPGPNAPPAPRQPERAAPARAQQRPDYIVEPPDLILVEVLEALPGRPISGERLVRPDGRISLGFYGDLPVAGLTIAQIKERIVLHMRKFISDQLLGLIEFDSSGEIKRDPNGRIIINDPRETDRVFVDVTAYNSQSDYILGEVLLPGRLPYTGGDTVLDLLQYGGGLLPTADKSQIRLIRSFPKGSPARVLPVNYDEIAMGTDSSTNYAILPNDRLVIPRVAANRPGGDAGRSTSSRESPAQDLRATRASATQSAPSLYFNRRSFTQESPTADLEKRIEELETKLDRLIEVVEKSQPKPGAQPEPQGPPDSVEGSPTQGEPAPVEAMDSPSAGTTRESTPRRGILRPRPRPGRVGPSGPRRPGARRPQPAEPSPSTPEARPSQPDRSASPAPPVDAAPPDRLPER
jgi:protein involved in polysaccharide export with SLBB domain